MNKLLKFFTTRALVEELKKREGVDTTIVEYRDGDALWVDGPAIVLVITDQEAL